MKRRDFFKGMTAAGSGMLCTPRSLRALVQGGGAPSEAGPPQVRAIRGLIEKGGSLWQPIEVSFLNPGPETEAVVRVDGQEASRRKIGPGAQTIEALAAAVETERKADIRVEFDGKAIPLTATLKPVRRVVVYVLPHSHTDIGYTEIQTAVEEKQVMNVRKGIELAGKTAGYPEGSRFVWNIEVLWAVERYMRRATKAEQKDLLEAIQKGWVALNGMFTNELTGLCRPEELLELFRYGRRFAEGHGVRIDAAMISDVPGYTWGTVTAMAQAGIRYFSAAPNFFDRIGTIMQQWQDKPFWWRSPSGHERVLLWIPWMGYAFSHIKKQLSPEVIEEYQERLDSVAYPYGISYMRWSGHGDNAEPDAELPEAIRSWNAKYAWPRFVISSTSTAFSDFEKQHGHQLPEYSGDLTPYWEDGAGSSALETAMNRNTADRLVQAEALFAMLPRKGYRAAEFDEAWRNVLLYSEHTWGAWCSVSDSENKLTKDQWEIKRSFAVEAAKESGELVSDALGTSGEFLAGTVDIYNATSWQRSEVVVLTAALSSSGDRVTGPAGEPWASQRLASGELAVGTSEIAPFSAARLSVGPGEASKPGRAVTVRGTELDNGKVRVRIDPTTGGIVELRLDGVEGNFADTTGREAVNEYLFLAGDDVTKIQASGPVKISVEEKGPLVASLRIESDAPGCKRLVRTVRLVAGSDYVEILNLVDKERAPLNPNPGKDPAFAQRKAKESVQFAFPFNIPEGKIRINAPFAVIEPERDQLPGSCKNWLPVGRWVDVANEEKGITWATLDAPLLEVGGITATKLGSQTNPDVWRKEIEPTQKFYSWVMNNHWSTNYRAYQVGPVLFRYALRPHRGYDAASASRFAVGLSQPLIAHGAADQPASEFALSGVEPPEVLVTALKSSEDGKAWIVRLFEASGRDQQATLKWRRSLAPGMTRSDLSERPGSRVDGPLTVRGFELVTIRVERPRE